jgi:hypothetical protein
MGQGRGKGGIQQGQAGRRFGMAFQIAKRCRDGRLAARL